MSELSYSHYAIEGKLGQGGMGVVYKARDTRLDRTVAIKVLPADKVTDPERRRRFLLEAKTASSLNHPNIITIHDIGQDHGADFIAMEYIDGKTLDQLIPREGTCLRRRVYSATSGPYVGECIVFAPPSCSPFASACALRAKPRPPAHG